MTIANEIALLEVISPWGIGLSLVLDILASTFWSTTWLMAAAEAAHKPIPMSEIKINNGLKLDPLVANNDPINEVISIIKTTFGLHRW